MAGKSDYLSAMLLNLIYKGTADAALAATVGSQTNIYFTLHTADPMATPDTGTQATSEVTVAQAPGFTRIAKARGAGFQTPTTTAGTTKVLPNGSVDFPAVTTTGGTGCTCTHFSTGLLSTLGSAGAILHSGIISPPIVIPAATAGVIPQLTALTEITEA